MKFKSLFDVQMFLSEVNPDLVESANDDFEPSKEMIELFIKKRKRIVPKLKDFQKSQNSKKMWRKHRYKTMKGIKSFHKSTQGKRMHRSIGRFLALRDTSKREIYSNPMDSNELFKSLSSCETHNFIELDFYRTLSEEIEYQIFSDMLQLRNYTIKKSIREDSIIHERDLDFLISLVPEKILIDELTNCEKNYDKHLKMFNDSLERLDDKEDYIYITAFNEVKYA